jgi:hypothetical protein
VGAVVAVDACGAASAPADETAATRAAITALGRRCIETPFDKVREG